MSKWTCELTIQTHSGHVEGRRGAILEGGVHDVVKYLKESGWRILYIPEGAEHVVAETNVTYGKLIGHWRVRR